MHISENLTNTFLPERHVWVCFCRPIDDGRRPLHWLLWSPDIITEMRPDMHWSPGKLVKRTLPPWYAKDIPKQGTFTILLFFQQHPLCHFVSWWAFNFVFSRARAMSYPQWSLKRMKRWNKKWLYKYLRCEKNRYNHHNLGPFSHTPSGPIALHYPDE